MFFGERDHMACHLVVLEAKKDTTGTGLGQPIWPWFGQVERLEDNPIALCGVPLLMVLLCSAEQCRAMGFAKEISKKSPYLISKNLSPTSDIPLFCF
ncbi:hypothetical protein N7465_001864 [Penicillium sp. CMV-2018d]|nr:hypothetical protein N7465_001864 [Penicillium sp. CMV-2018d]